jgi:hypothetical protein
MTTSGLRGARCCALYHFHPRFVVGLFGLVTLLELLATSRPGFQSRVHRQAWQANRNSSRNIAWLFRRSQFCDRILLV